MCIIRSSVGSKAATILPADIKDYIISSNHGKNISIRIVRPVDSAIKFLPIVMYYHGDGWVRGGIGTFYEN